MSGEKGRAVGEEAARLAALAGVLVLLLGLAYPLLLCGYARVDASRADGGIVFEGGRAVGARDVGQQFTSERYFHGRPSAAGAGYDAMAGGASNLGPSNPELGSRAAERLRQFLEENPGVSPSEVPVEMVTGSASGLDPHLSEESAQLQVPRVAGATGIPEEDLSEMVRDHVRGRFLGIFGQPRVNVLELNLEVQRMLGEVSR